MISFERTAGTDDRSRLLREAMDTETFAMYAAGFEALPAAERERTMAALSTDPADLTEVVIAIEDGVLVGHAALRRLADGILEVKKVYVIPSARGRGLSRLLMDQIEDVARELGDTALYLQTGPLQREALALYADIGYEPVPAFGPYAQLDFPLCFVKQL